MNILINKSSDIFWNWDADARRRCVKKREAGEKIKEKGKMWMRGGVSSNATFT
jgi:hypothetical protein